MKIFFWLLIALNVILFAVMKSGMLDGSAAPALQPLHAEKIILMVSEPAQSAPVAASVQSAPLSAPTSAPLSAPALATVSASVPLPATVAASAGACFEWGEFSGLALDQVKKSLEKLSLGEKLSQRDVERVIGFWVYIAPLSNKAAVNQKLLQLKTRGVTDYFVVQESGEWFNAISLGIFKSRDSAQNFLQELRNKGVNSAQIRERAGKSRGVVFVFNGVDAQMAVKLTTLQKNFAASELKRVQCH